MLNNIGASTLPCGSPFRCRRQRLFFSFSNTKKRLLSGMVRISGRSGVHRQSSITHLAEEASAVDRVVGSRHVHEYNTGDQALLVAIFDVLSQVQ